MRLILVIARRDSLHSVSSGPPAYELESKPPSVPSIEEVRPDGDGPVRSISFNSSSTSSPPLSFSAVSASAPDLFSREVQETGPGMTPTFQVEAATPSSTSSGVFGGGSSLPGPSRNATSTFASTSAASESSAPFSPTTSFAPKFITLPPTQMTTAAVAMPASVVGSSSQPSPTSSYTPTITTMYRLGANVHLNLTSPALSESFSRPVQPLKVPNRAGSPPVTAAMTGNNNCGSGGGGGAGGGLGPGAMAASTPASFNQRGAGSPPQRIIEEDETLSNNSNTPYPIASQPYPGAGAGGGGASGSGSGGTSRNGSGYQSRSDQSQREVPGLGGGGMAGGGGGGYATSIAGMSDVMSFGNRSMSTVMANPVLLAGALQAEVKAGRKDELSAQKLITAGLVPTLILLLKTRAASSGEGLDFVLMTLGALSYDTISSNTIFRTNTTTTLIELFTSSYSDEISALSIWCLTRICRSAEIAQELIKAGLVKHLLTKGLRGGQGAARLSAWCVGSLIHTDAIAETLADMVIPDMVEHLRQSTNNPESSSEDICFAIGRMARSIKLSNSLAKAGCIEPLAHHLNMSDDPRVLYWSARAVGCLMRPNSSDMSRLLLDAGIASGLARMPSVGSHAPNGGGGTRKAFVEAGVVDSLLAALRTAADEPYPQVHIELALAVSFLGDVGGKDIRKEIVSAGGVKILKKVGSVGSPEVAKACNMAATSITGNIWTRNAASAKTAMTHNWSGGCPAYHPPCPVLIQEDEEIDRLGHAFSEGVRVID
ncbi:ARM repeat-containing protein [Dendrothele bispora CBS 962.96]|uniref:ARM repeat-containing protein n=1 Tax=Dendrothele bispora (strain CBS 962.96) TaxID=1314807 RepID=A0A4S8L6F0_DENBC|nr:ARM repeat-containing protein [Dendrothele bispora CBS 962.96]